MLDCVDAAVAEVPAAFRVAALSLVVLDPELPHDALPCAEPEPFFPLALEA